MSIQPIISNAPSLPQQSAAPATGDERPAKSAPQTAADAELTSAPPSPQQLHEAVGEINKALESASENLQFAVDQDTGKTVVKVIDSSTNEVIRQIPSQEVLAIARSLDRLQGILFKQKA